MKVIILIFLYCCLFLFKYSSHVVTAKILSMNTIKNKFINYYEAFEKLKNNLNTDYIKNNNFPRRIYAHYDHEIGQIIFLNKKSENSNIRIIANGMFNNMRNKTGWDNLYIKTYANINPIIQLYTAGIIEGVLTNSEIEYHFNNINLMHNFNEAKKLLRNFFIKVDSALSANINIHYFQTLTESELKKWMYVACLYAQFEGMIQGYNLVNKKQLDKYDFYLMNYKGNLKDLIYMLKLDKIEVDDEFMFSSDTNLHFIFNSTNAKEIWKNMRSNGVGLIAYLKQNKTVNTKHLFDFDSNGKDTNQIYVGHNTYGPYTNLLKMLKHYDFDFEKNIQILGMERKIIKFSSYPGLIYSSDDFYSINSSLVITSTNLKILNKFIFKNRIEVDKHIPDFIRIMTANYMARGGLEWAELYKNFCISTFYNAQWSIVDYKNPKIEFVYAEEVPGSIKYSDMTNKLRNNTFFQMINIPIYEEHIKLLGYDYLDDNLIHYDNFKHNPLKFYVNKYFNKQYNNNTKGSPEDIIDFTNLMTHNSFNKTDSLSSNKFNLKITNGTNPNSQSYTQDPSFYDPVFSPYPRYDLIGNFTDEGGLDFKIVNKYLTKDNMKIYAYSGPLFHKEFNSGIKAFVNNNKHTKGIPRVWNFKPILF